MDALCRGSGVCNALVAWVDAARDVVVRASSVKTSGRRFDSRSELDESVHKGKHYGGVLAWVRAVGGGVTVEARTGRHHPELMAVTN